MADLSRLCLNTVTLRSQWALRDCIEGSARHGIGYLSVWRQDLEDIGLTAVARQVRDCGITVPLLTSAGWFPGPDRPSRAAAIEDGIRGIDTAAGLGAECLLVVPGGLPDGAKDIADARSQVYDGLARLIEYARTARIYLALEPFHPMYAADKGCVCSLTEALDVCDSLGEGIGVVVDIYHLWWDVRLEAELERAAGRILAYQVSDWVVPIRDPAQDRGMMGDGVIDIPRITRRLDEVGYRGPIDVEIFSAFEWSTRDPDTVLTVIRERFECCV